MQFFTQADAEMDNFIQIPKALIFDEKYAGLEASDMLVYGLLKDRHSVSIKNEWIDEKGRIYFNYSDEELSEIIGKSIRTINRIKSNLKKHNLIHVVKMGLNRKSRLYLLKIESENNKYIPKKNDDKKDSKNDVKANDSKDMTPVAYPDATPMAHSETTPVASTDATPVAYPMSKTKSFSYTNSSNNKYQSRESAPESIERRIEKLDVPIQIRKILMNNKKRLIDDDINLNQIKNIYELRKHKYSMIEFCETLSNALIYSKQKINDIERLISSSLVKNQKPKKVEEEPKSDVPDNHWVHEHNQKRQKELEESRKKQNQMTPEEREKEMKELQAFINSFKKKGVK